MCKDMGGYRFVRTYRCVRTWEDVDREDTERYNCVRTWRDTDV